MFIDHLTVFFGEMSLQVLCPFLNWVVSLSLSFRNSPYILDIMIFKHSFPFCGMTFYFVESVVLQKILKNFNEVLLVLLFLLLAVPLVSCPGNHYHIMSNF